MSLAAENEPKTPQVKSILELNVSHLCKIYFETHLLQIFFGTNEERLVFVYGTAVGLWTAGFDGETQAFIYITNCFVQSLLTTTLR